MIWLEPESSGFCPLNVSETLGLSTCFLVNSCLSFWCFSVNSETSWVFFHESPLWFQIRSEIDIPWPWGPAWMISLALFATICTIHQPGFAFPLVFTSWEVGYNPMNLTLLNIIDSCDQRHIKLLGDDLYF